SESGDEPDPGGPLPPSVPRCRPYVRVCPCLPICPVRVSALAAAPASSACLPRLSCLPCLSLPAPACLDRAVRAGRRRGHEQPPGRLVVVGGLRSQRGRGVREVDRRRWHQGEPAEAGTVLTAVELSHLAHLARHLVHVAVRRVAATEEPGPGVPAEALPTGALRRGGDLLQLGGRAPHPGPDPAGLGIPPSAPPLVELLTEPSRPRRP